MLISDAMSLAGTGDGRVTIGGLEVEVVGDRVTGRHDDPGRLDHRYRRRRAQRRRGGHPVAGASAAASANPLAMLGVTDRGRLAVGQRADLVALDDGLRVRRVMRSGAWLV